MPPRPPLAFHSLYIYSLYCRATRAATGSLTVHSLTVHSLYIYTLYCRATCAATPSLTLGVTCPPPRPPSQILFLSFSVTCVLQMRARPLHTQVLHASEGSQIAL